MLSGRSMVIVGGMIASAAAASAVTYFWLQREANDCEDDEEYIKERERKLRERRLRRKSTFGDEPDPLEKLLQTGSGSMRRLSTGVKFADEPDPLAELFQTGSGKKLERLDTLAFQKSFDEKQLEPFLKGLNDDLSPVDNAASMLHLMSLNQNISEEWRGALVYAITALKSLDDESTLPAALQDSPEHPQPSPQKEQPADDITARKSKMRQDVFSGSAHPRLMSKGWGLEDSAVSPILGRRGSVESEQQLVYRWLRSEYSHFNSSFQGNTSRSGSIVDMPMRTSSGRVDRRRSEPHTSSWPSIRKISPPRASRRTIPSVGNMLDKPAAWEKEEEEEPEEGEDTFHTTEQTGPEERSGSAVVGGRGRCALGELFNVYSIVGSSSYDADAQGGVSGQEIECFVPTSEEEAAIAQALDGVDDWNFDIFRLAEACRGHPLQVVGWHVLRHWGLIPFFGLDESKLKAWLAFIESQYIETPYHNSTHAADVTQTVHAVLVTGGLRNYLTEVQVLAVLLTAMMHDVGHDGLNNTYHKNALTTRARTFNDQSIQENFHLRMVFDSMQTRPQINFMDELDYSLVGQLRDLMIHMVLHTDMSKHFVSLKEFKLLAEKNKSSPELWQPQVLPLLSHVLHTCDISAQAKTRELAVAWCERCMEEFFLQGDAEKEEGLPVSPLCDRDSTPVAASQIGFIQFVVLPQFQALALVLPQASRYVDQLNSNVAYWQSLVK